MEEENNPNREGNLFLGEEEQKPLIENGKKETNLFQEEPKLLLDKIISNASFTKYQIYTFISLAFLFLLEGMEICLLGVALIPFKEKFNLSQGLLEFTSSILFLGIAFGSVISGFLAKKIGRIYTIIISVLLISIVHLLMGIFLNLLAFIICRILIGIFLGILLPIILNLYLEYQVGKYRIFFTMVIYCFSGLGLFLEGMIAFLIMPLLRHEKLNQFICILVIFPVLSFIICVFLLNDSPRNLILKNNEDEKSLNKAFKIIESMKKSNLSEEEKIQIIDEINESEVSNGVKGKVKEMFKNKYKKSTILLIIIYFILSCCLFGNYMISTMQLNHLINKNNFKQNLYSHKDIIINQIIISFSFIIFHIIGGIVGEIKALRRKRVIMVFSFLAGISLIPAMFTVILFRLFFPLSIGLTAITFNLISCSIIGIYQTNLVNTSKKFLFIIFTISSFLSQYIYFGFVSINYKISFILSTAFLLISTGLNYFIPYEFDANSLNEI